MSWVLVPLAAIGLAVFQTWVRFQARQRTLGTTTKEIEHTITLLKAELEAEQRDRNTLLRRIEHLEAIVTSQVWDVWYTTRPTRDPNVPRRLLRPSRS
jgi:hypothetical protein